MGELKRYTPLNRGTKGLKRARLSAGCSFKGPSGKRRTRVNPVNSKRKRERHARNFGAEADAVRGMKCLVTGETPSEPAHVTSRGAGGGRYDLVPLSPAMHRQQHNVGIRSFEAAHGLDLRAEADRVALLHDAPLGVRGLAQRWVWTETGLDAVVDDQLPEPLTDYEREALLGWVRRRMAAVSAKWLAESSDHAEWDTTAAWFDVADALGLDTEQAHALCELAGWPS